MTLFRKILSGFLVVVLLFIAFLYVFDYDYILKGLSVTYLKGYSTAYIDDYPYFDNRVIQASDNPQPWPIHPDFKENEPQSLAEFNEEMETTAFLVIKNDKIWFEKYYRDYAADSLTNSFSMAKSMVSAMLGRAIQDGYIESLEQPVSDFFPGFDPSLSVGDLASMASGLNWDENYFNPFGMTARAYYDDDIRELLLNLEVTEEPGKEFKYLSGNTQLLGMVLEKATGQKLSNYLSDNFWKPLGTENYALWQLDSQESGMEKAYCCISSNARDFARFGKLYKDHGKWKGERLLDSAFVAKSVQARFEDSPQYGYGWWLSDYKDKSIFYMRGVLGQYVIAIPEDDLIIVRLGRQFHRPRGEKHSKDFYRYLDETYKMLNDAA